LEASRAQRFFDMKRQGKPIVMLTAYDAPTAQAEWQAGVDIILVGDSVGTNVLGYASEREVTLADICHHVRAVRRGAPEAFILADLPYNTYETPDSAITHARSLVEAGANMVKFEGPHPRITQELAAAGIAVCCHLGLEPQHHEEKRLKSRSAEEAVELLAAAMELDRLGMAMLLLELVPEEVAALITRSVKAPVIGIGAGRYTDGQVLVVTDLLGRTEADFRHNKRYAETGLLQQKALQAYAGDVRQGVFPAEANVFHMSADELAAFMSAATR
jgi:3-methyl-2-oxobutanoate hydroxymethyltransferase